jgi:uncharacterized protein YkwD
LGAKKVGENIAYNYSSPQALLMPGIVQLTKKI